MGIAMEYGALVLGAGDLGLGLWALWRLWGRGQSGRLLGLGLLAWTLGDLCLALAPALKTLGLELSPLWQRLGTLAELPLETLGWFLLYDVEGFRGLQIFIIITQLAAMLVYIVWPSIQDLRPTEFPRDNFLTRVMAFIYSFDTPTGVCPSLHVAYSVGMASAWCKCKKAPAAWKGFVVLSAVVISIATAFVKQHSIIDVFAALPLAALAEILTYHVILPRLEKRRAGRGDQRPS